MFGEKKIYIYIYIISGIVTMRAYDCHLEPLYPMTCVLGFLREAGGGRYEEI